MRQLKAIGDAFQGLRTLFVPSILCITVLRNEKGSALSDRYVCFIWSYMLFEESNPPNVRSIYIIYVFLFIEKKGREKRERAPGGERVREREKYILMCLIPDIFNILVFPLLLQ